MTAESAAEVLPVDEGWATSVAPLARTGWAARGISYVISGGIAVALAAGLFTEDADQKGALRLVADATGGSALLLLLGAGLALFAIWEATHLLVMRGLDVLTWLDRIGKLIGILFYGSLALTAIRLALLSSSSDAKWTVERLSATALQYPLGRVALAFAGGVVAAIAIRRGRRTLTGDYSDDLKLQSAGDAERQLIDGLGRAGELGRSLSFVLIAVFLMVAGWQGQATEAGGLDSTLRQTTQTTGGSVLVAITGLGLVAYGLFCVASARHREMPVDSARE
ncbi:MAG: DUF1206 domain-containing protein [Acidimicrobiales bacterium]|nr:DUF1206 domain-containing protein [Acidimicrobiales bacterium]